jgi:hypothetical protein
VPEKDNYRFLIIVNRDFQNLVKLIIATNDKVKCVLKDATLVLANVYIPTTEVASIYIWEK